MISGTLLPRLLALAAAGAPIACGAAALAVPGWAAKRYLLFYLAPIASAFALWLRLRLADPSWTGRTRALDAAVVTLAALRFAGGFVPVFGHMLFFTYSGLTTGAGWYRALALALAAETTYFKLVLWADARSWCLGIAAGAAAALLHGIRLRDVRATRA